MDKKVFQRTLTAVACLFILAMTRQVDAQSFDRKRAEREIEIMSGILQTTIKYAAEDVTVLRTSSTDEPTVLLPFGPQGFRTTAVEGYYLFDQGVTFTVAVPPLVASKAVYSDWSTALRSYDDALQALRYSEHQRDEELDRERASKEALRKKLEQASRYQAEAKEKVKRKQEELRQQLEAYEERFTAIKDHLLEALADHGDSLTFLPDDEYINLVLASNTSLAFGGSGVAFFGDLERSGAGFGSEVLSVKKSWVVQYKKGGLSLEEFKGKVLKY